MNRLKSNNNWAERAAERVEKWWHNFNKRRRVAISNTQDNREIWRTHISALNICAIIASATLLILLLTLTLVAYTPILKALPKYSTQAQRQRQEIVETILKIDSLERVVNQVIQYSDNVELIMSGRLPNASQNFTTEATAISKDIRRPNSADSLLRAQMEGEGRYNLKFAEFNAQEIMVAPADGVVTRGFDMAKGELGIEIAASNSQVIATQKGIVALAKWSHDEQYIIQIVHPNNTISIYKNIKSALVKRGDSVKQGAIIGNTESSEEKIEPIEFEIWYGGRPVDPELFITR